MEISQLFDRLLQVFKYTLFHVNETPVTLTSILTFILIFATIYIFSRLFTRMLGKKILVKARIRESTVFTMQRLTHYVIVIIGAIVSFQFIGINLSGLAVILGLLSVGIGFGLQNITSNFMAGLILLFEKPIKIGDRVTVGDVVGDVIAINMRSTTIRSLQNIAIIVPNSEFISQRVTNWSYGDPTLRLEIDVGVSYASDPDAVEHSLREVAAENPQVLKSPAPEVIHKGFGDSSWNMQLRCWIGTPQVYWKTIPREGHSTSPLPPTPFRCFFLSSYSR
jgi:small-conductance mechanosensitive channel